MPITLPPVHRTDRSNDTSLQPNAPNSPSCLGPTGAARSRGGDVAFQDLPPRLVRTTAPERQIRRGASLPPARQLACVGGVLSADLGIHYRRQRAYERSVALDQVGLSTYAVRRRQQLAALPGAEVISAQYAINLAGHIDDLQTLAGLRLDSPYSGQYQREFQSEQFHADCRGLYEAQGGKRDDHVVFVHSDYAARQVLNRFELPCRNKARVQVLALGLIAIRCDSLAAADNANDWITILGARPSAYRVARLACSLGSDEVMNPAINNRSLLANLHDDAPGSCLAALRDIPEHHSAHALARTGAALIEDMVQVLERSGKTEVFDHSPILANGLLSLTATAEAMPTLAQRSDRFANAYQAMIEELQVVLMVTRPYSEADFKQAASRQFAARMGTIAGQHGIAAPEIFLMSSGMGALACAFELVATLNGHDKTRLASSVPSTHAPDYYEIQQLLSRKNLVNESDVVSATLNPSTTQKRGPADEAHEWNVQALVKELDGQLRERSADAKPLTIVLDTTIERRGDMQTLLDRFSPDIAAGRMRLVVCKSYQKFANLGATKVMAGSIALLAIDDEVSQLARQQLRKTEQEIGWAGNDEIQLLTHFVRNGDSHEFALLERAASNAAFVQTVCFGASVDHQGFDKYDEGLPLAVIDTPGDTNQNFAFADRAMKFGRDDHLLGLIPFRDSFSFATTTMVAIESDGLAKGLDAIRLSFGLESRAELIEMFYAPGLFMRARTSTWGSIDARDHITTLVDRAMADIDPARALHARSLKDRIVLIGAAEAERQDTDASRSGLTQRMRANLHRDSDHSGFTVNRIASVIEHMARIISLNETWKESYVSGPDREIADVLLDGLIGAGMPGVSEAGRVRVVDFKVELALIDMQSDDPSIRQRGVHSLLNSGRRLADADQRAKHLVKIPDTVFGEMPDATREQLIDQLFRPLDIQSRRALVEKQGDGAITRACAMAMKRDMASARDGQRKLLYAETLDSRPINDTGPPPIMTDREF